MNARRWIPFAVSAACAVGIALLRPRAGDTSAAVPAGALARVGERFLTEADVQRRLALLRSTAWGTRPLARRGGDAAPPDVPDAATVLETLIEEELLFRHGRDSGYLEDDTVRRHVIGRVWEEAAREGGEARLRALLEELRERHRVEVLRRPSPDPAPDRSTLAPLAEALLVAVARDVEAVAPLSASQQHTLRGELTVALERLATADPRAADEAVRAVLSRRLTPAQRAALAAGERR